MSVRKIILIEDDEDIVELLRFNLEKEGYKVLSSPNGETGLTLIQESPPSLLILDLGLPGIQGLEICRLLKQRSETRAIPIIILTAKGQESDVVAGLEMGADDYIVKPFRIRELVARVRAVQRRSGTPETSVREGIISSGPLSIDPLRHEVYLGEELLSLTLAEFNLLKTLISQVGRVFTREQLLNAITGGDAYIIDRNVDVHIRAIRKKIGKERDRLVTVRGIGYKFLDTREALL